MMTTPNDALIEEVRAMVERLTATVPQTVHFSTCRTAPIITKSYDAPVNPDGPDAAALITRLMEGRG